jgi:hypothetical protein
MAMNFKHVGMVTAAGAAAVAIGAGIATAQPDDREGTPITQQDRGAGRRRRTRRSRQLTGPAMTPGRVRRPLTALLGAVVVVLAAGCGGGQRPGAAECIKAVDESGEPTDACLPLAPESDRVDLATPTFSNPTAITNRLTRQASSTRRSTAVTWRASRSAPR